MLESHDKGFYAKIVADSISSDGHRITTMEVRYPRFIHSELMTHRVFTVNSASSRAIPFKKMLDSVENDPALPVKWLSEQPGMSGGAPLDKSRTFLAAGTVNYLRKQILKELNRYLEVTPEPSERLHKSLLNRYLEPWLWHTSVITSTAWENFFDLRCDPAADENIQCLASLMKDALSHSKPKSLERGEWHTPYVDDPFPGSEQSLKVSTARVARASYLGAGKDNTLEADLKLYDRLLESRHMSPFAHVATPDSRNIIGTNIFDPFYLKVTGTITCPRYGNLLGWQSWRHTIEARENVRSFK